MKTSKRRGGLGRGAPGGQVLHCGRLGEEDWPSALRGESCRHRARAGVEEEEGLHEDDGEEDPCGDEEGS